MKNFRIIKLSKKVIIFQLRISKHKLLELQLEFNIWDIIKFSDQIEDLSNCASLNDFQECVFVLLL